MVFYGLTDLTLATYAITEWFNTREEALATIERVLEDEPDWVNELGVLRVDFGRGDSELETLD